MQFALVWWLTEKTGSATVLTFSTVLTVLPWVFVGPFADALEIVLRLRAATLGQEAAEAGLTLAEKNAWFQVRAAEAAIQTAEAQRDAAQVQLTLVQAEVTDEEIAVAEGAVGPGRGRVAGRPRRVGSGDVARSL